MVNPVFLKRNKNVISVVEALTQIAAGFKPLGLETISIDQALGRALGKDVASRITHPPVAVSSMDGYAIRAEDAKGVPFELTKIGESKAGCGFNGTVGLNEATRIFTGAPLPEGADTVVIQENTETDGQIIRVLVSVTENKFVRPAGLDFSIGDILLHKGQILTARDIGLLASMNVPWIKVHRKPRVAIMSTGDELVLPGGPVGTDQIINSNSLACAAYITAMGGEPVNLGIARDTKQSLLDTLAGAKGADLLITIGGASVGDYDLVQSVMREQGLELGFYRIAMRPGKPLIFGQLNGVPVLGLPGNPVSAGVTTALFVKMAMDIMLGLGDTQTNLESVALGTDLNANDQRQDYLRATLATGANAEIIAIPFNRQDSAMMSCFAKADCLIVRAPFSEAIKKGELISILRLNFCQVRF